MKYQLIINRSNPINAAIVREWLKQGQTDFTEEKREEGNGWTFRFTVDSVWEVAVRCYVIGMKCGYTELGGIDVKELPGEHVE